MYIQIRFAAVMTALLLMLAGPLQAQREDTPLSASYPVYTMVVGAKAQTADSANGVVAAVWGTTELLNEDSVYAVFYVQLVRDGRPAGSPIRLGKPGDRLMSDIRVVPLGRDFLILFNSYMAAGTFSQFLETASGRLGEPNLCSPVRLVTDRFRRGITVMGGGANPWRIFWYAPHLVTGTFHQRGVPLEVLARLGGTIEPEILSYENFPGIVAIAHSQGTISGIYSRADGRPLPGLPALNGPFHLGRNGSLLIVQNSTLLLYPSIFDASQQALQRELPLSAWRVEAGNGLLWRDPAGAITLYFPTGVSGSDSLKRSAFSQVLRLRLGSFSGPIVADTILADSLVVGWSNSTYLESYERVAGNNNNNQVGIRFKGPLQWYSRYFTLDSTGTFAQSQSRFPNNYGVSTEIVPVRIDREGASRVEIRLRDTVALQVPVTPIPHQSPAIVAFPGSLACTWRESDTATRDVYGIWDLRGDSIKSRSVYMPPPRVEFSGVWGATSMSRFPDERDVVFPGDAGLAYNYLADGTGRIYNGSRNPTELITAVASSRYALARPGEKGWVGLDTIIHITSSGPPPVDHIQWSGEIVGYDPDFATIVVLIRRYEHKYLKGYMLYGYDRTKLAWELDRPWNITEKSIIVPMGKGRYVLVDSLKSYYVRDNKPADSFELPMAGHVNSRYAKLFDARFARTSWDADDSTLFHVEIFNNRGTRIHAARLKTSAQNNDYMLLQSPADSSFVVLFGGDHGVRGTVLKKDLTPMVVDTLLSATSGRVSHPAGAFRGDTLFLVWEDHRDTLSRMYGTYHSGSWLPSSVDEEVAPINEIADNAAFIYPNPAGDAMTITAYSRNGDGLLYDMSDVLGREILHGRMAEGEIGETSTTVDISAVPPGAYIVRLWNNGRARAQVVVKR